MGVVLRLRDDNVPFDNNAAERSLRMVKLYDKISPCFHSLDGAEAFVTVRCYLQTAFKHGAKASSGSPPIFDRRTLATTQPGQRDVDDYHPPLFRCAQTAASCGSRPAFTCQCLSAEIGSGLP